MRSKRNLVPLSSLVSFVVCLFALGCAGAPHHHDWGNATAADHFERLMWKAVQEKDWTNFERRLSPTFVGVTPAGELMDRAAWVAYWKSVEFKDHSLGDVKAEPEGADYKVVSILQIQANSTVPAAGLRVVSIWQLVKTRWVLTATTITPIQTK
jgi:hypothetical protein